MFLEVEGSVECMEIVSCSKDIVVSLGVEVDVGGSAC